RCGQYGRSYRARNRRGAGPWLFFLVGGSDGADFGDLRDIIFEQLLDAVLERRGRGGAARAGALHLQIDFPLVEAAIDDVAAVIGDRGADARLDQLLDLRDDLGIGGIVGDFLVLGGDREAGARGA